MQQLTRLQIEIFSCFTKDNLKMSQEQLEEYVADDSFRVVGRTEKELTEKGLIANGIITNASLVALEPYRFRRAIFIAAGFGTGLVPVTLKTPKLQVCVHG